MTIKNPLEQIVYSDQKSEQLWHSSVWEKLYEKFYFTWDIPKLYRNEGIHNIKVEIFESNDLQYKKSSEFLVFKKLPPVAPIIDMLLLSPSLDEP